MASNRIKGAKTAVKLLKNAEKVNNICSDVIGDICGIISGALGAAIVLKIFSSGGINADTSIISILFSSLTAAITVGGKALGKRIAMTNSREIVYFVARVLSVFSKNK
jgi:CBS domain containing-hemolysin-like protein